MEYFISFVFGATVGSFVNVCVHRIPREISLNKPRSRCSFCGQLIAWFDNIPICSYLRLGGKCRYCSTYFSPRYLLIEVFTGLLFAICYLRLVGMQRGYPPTSLDPEPFMRFWFHNPEVMVSLIVGWCFVVALVVATFIDFEFQIIPDSVTIGGFWVALVISFLFPYFHWLNAPDVVIDDLILMKISDFLIDLPWGVLGNFRGLISALVGGAVGAGSVWIVGFIGRIVFRKEAMGFGDVKYNAMIGAFLGWKVALGTLLLGSVLGALAGIIVLLKTRQSRMPFGPYLSLAAGLLFLFREPLFRLPVWWTNWLGRNLPI